MLKSLKFGLRLYSASTKFDFNKDYYKILQVKPNSTKASIRNSYLNLAKKYHPDLNSQGKEKFTNIHQAYQVLSNEKTRKQYDSFKNIHHYDQHHRSKSEGNRFKERFYQEGRQEQPQKNKQRKNSSQKWASSQIDWEEFERRQQEWKKQFYQTYGEQPAYQKPAAKRQRTEQEEEFLKTQRIFSDRNPFWNPSLTQNIMSGIQKKRQSDARKDLGIDEYLQKIKKRFWK